MSTKGTFMTVAQIGLFAFLPFAVEQGNVWWWLLALVMYTLYGGVGVVVTMHRLITHRAFKSGRTFRYVGTFLGTVGSLLSPLEWAQQHVAHHRYSDTEKDPHSPVIMGWRAMFFALHHGSTGTLTVVRLGKERFMRFLHEYFYWVLAGWVALLYLIGSLLGAGREMVVFGWVLPCLGTLWGQVLAVMAHDEDGAKNGNWFTRAITFNETFHKYHHENPGDITRDGIAYWFINLVRTDKENIR